MSFAMENEGRRRHSRTELLLGGPNGPKMTILPQSGEGFYFYDRLARE